MMKIGIDTLGCNHGKSGFGMYLLSLVANLHNGEDLTFELFGSEFDRYTYSSDSSLDYSGFRIPDKEKKEIGWHKHAFKSFTKRRKYDAVIVPAAAKMFPAKFKVKTIAIVNSLFPESGEIQNIDASLMKLVQNLKKADKIIVASLHIRKNLEKLGIDGEKIAIVHLGIDHSHFYPRPIVSESTVEIKPFAIRRPYFVYASSMGTLKKKHIELIKAFSVFKEKTHLPHRLVIAGTEGPCTEEIIRTARECCASSDIFITGFYPHDSLPELYSYSEGCIFPSVVEGVGLPVLEAMATGIPVACSKSGALPEIARNNALFFDSDNIEEIAECFTKLALNNSLRKSLISGGIEWSKRFSWEKTAEKTTEIIRSLI